MDPFASPADLATWVQRDVAPDLGDLAVRVASGAIRSHCGWPITETTATIAYPVAGGVVWLPTLHLTRVVVTDAGVTVPAGADVAWSRDGRVVCNRRPAGTATITYTHGYSWPDPVLDLVAGVCLSAAARAVDNPRGLRSWTVGGESETYAGGGSEVAGSVLTGAERADLAGLVLPVIA